MVPSRLLLAASLVGAIAAAAPTVPAAAKGAASRPSLRDVTPPRLGRVATAAGRGSFTIRFTASEGGKATGRLDHRVRGRFRLIGATAFPVRRRVNRLRFMRIPRALRLSPGRYRLTFAVRDAAGNRSASKRVEVTVAG